MRLAVSWVVRDVRGYADLVRRCEEAGFDAIGVPDTTAPVYREVYVAMTLAVAATERAEVISMVTNARTRHAGVSANALSTLAELSGGRVACGIGTGDSAVASLGLRPSTRAELSEYIHQVRSRVGHRDVIVPMYLAAEGPKLTRLAGQIGDGILMAGDMRPARVAWYREHLAEGASSVGRALPEDFAMWGLLRASVADDAAVAWGRAAPALAAAANHTYRSGFNDSGLTDDQQAAVRTLQSEYIVDSHNDFTGGNPNGAAVRRLGLTDVLGERFGLVGDPADCAARLRALAQSGLPGLVIRPVGTDPDRFLELWSQVRAEYARAGDKPVPEPASPS
jgi:5,10-methylenetetrahydromethanopterin reductase